MPKQLKKAIAYVRVSTHGQEENGHGLELQEIRIREFAGQEGYEIVDIFKDAHTGMGEGSFDARPGMTEAAALSKTEGWPIIVDGLDRFARNLKKLEELVASGYLTVISAKDGVGVSRGAMMGEAARAQREGELISISTKRALQKLKQQGVRLGNTKNLPEAQAMAVAANKAKADKITRNLAPVIEQLRQAGKLSAQEIADGLNELGRRTARNGLWKATNIRRLLKRADELMIAQRAAEKAQEVTEEAKRYKDNPLWGAF